MKPKQPLFHVVKRDHVSRGQLVLAYVLAVVIAVAVGAVLLTVMGVPFGAFYQKMFTLGLLDNKFAYKNVENFIKLFVPLLITSLALALAFRMRFWNIGGEGQFTLGALCAGAVAMQLGDSLPRIVVLLLMALAGMLGGGLYGVIAAILKVRYGTNETLLTLMFNYMALYLLAFFGETRGAWNFFLDPQSPRPRFMTFPEGAQMLTIPLGKFSLNVSLLVALALCAGIFVYLKYTKQGYEIAVVGESRRTASYAGIKVDRVIIRTMALSGALCGLIGLLLTSSTDHTMTTTIVDGRGFTAVMVSWMAKFNPIIMIFVSLLLVVLSRGASEISTAFGLNRSFSDILTGIILFFIIGCEFFINYKVQFRSSGKKEA